MAGGGGRSFVARYLIDGTLDTGYSGDGFTPLDFSAGRDLAMDLALQADEAAVIAATVADDRRYGIAGSSPPDGPPPRMRPVGSAGRVQC